MTAARGCRKFMQLSTVYGHGISLKPGTPRLQASPRGVKTLHRCRTLGLAHEREGVEDVAKLRSGQFVHARDSRLELSPSTRFCRVVTELFTQGDKRAKFH